MDKVTWINTSDFFIDAESKTVEDLFVLLNLLNITNYTLITWQAGEDAVRKVIGVEYTKERDWIWRNITP